MSSTTAIGRPFDVVSENIRNGRLGELSVGTSMANDGVPRPSHGSEIDQAFGNANSTWTGAGIWTRPSTKGPFGGPASESFQGKSDTMFKGAGSVAPDGPTTSGCLVPSSEVDSWQGRNEAAWGVEMTRPGSAHTQAQESNMLPLRSRTNNPQPAAPQLLDYQRKDIASLTGPRQNTIGQSSSGSNTPYRNFMDSTLNNPTSNGSQPPRNIQLSGNAKPFSVPNTVEEPQQYTSPIGLVLGSTEPRAAVGLDTEIISSRSGSASVAGSQYGSLANGGFPPGHGSQLPGSLSSHRPTQPQYHLPFPAQANARKYDEFIPEQKDADPGANKFHLRPEPTSVPLGNPYRVPTSMVSGNAGNPGGLGHALRHPSGSPYDFSPVRQTPPPRSRGSWTAAEGERSHSVGSFTPEGYPEGPFSEQLGPYRTSRANKQGSRSPLESEYRKGLHSPYYSTGSTPAPDPDHVRAPSHGPLPGRVYPNSALLDRKLRGLQQEQQGYMMPPGNPVMMRPDPYRGQFLPNAYEYGAHGGSGLNPLGSYLPLLQMLPGQVPPRSSTRDHDVAHSPRSTLLEEFRSNSKTSKRYELRDIYDHVVEFSGDQYGSRFIQQKLETANSDEKEQVFREIKPNSLQLMTDVFGNYVIQKFFEHGTQQQKTILAEQMKGRVLTLSLQMYGCRVVQKALEHILVNQQASLVKEIEPHVLKCVKDQNGNHVIQKAIERVPLEYTQFIIDAFIGQVSSLATHPYGCRVIQRMLEHCGEQAQAAILNELYERGAALIQDQYGNYVTQHVIEHGKDEDRSKIIHLVTLQLVHYSKHKFASNVVEKSIEFGTDEHRRIFLAILTANSNGTPPLQSLMRDQYGNYVIQKLLAQLKDADREKLVEEIKPQLASVKKYSHGKQIIAIERLLANAHIADPSETSPVAPPTPSAANTMPFSGNPDPSVSQGGTLSTASENMRDVNAQSESPGSAAVTNEVNDTISNTA